MSERRENGSLVDGCLSLFVKALINSQPRPQSQNPHPRIRTIRSPTGGRDPRVVRYLRHVFLDPGLKAFSHEAAVRPIHHSRTAVFRECFMIMTVHGDGRLPSISATLSFWLALLLSLSLPLVLHTEISSRSSSPGLNSKNELPKYVGIDFPCVPPISLAGRMVGSFTPSNQSGVLVTTQVIPPHANATILSANEACQSPENIAGLCGADQSPLASTFFNVIVGTLLPVACHRG